jgi:hypothetical protein
LDMVSTKFMMLTHLSAAGQGRLADFLDCGNQLLDDLDGAIEWAKMGLKSAHGKTAIDDLPAT